MNYRPLVIVAAALALTACGSSNGDGAKADSAPQQAQSPSPTRAALNTGDNALKLGQAREGNAVSNELTKIDRNYRENDTVDPDPGNVWFGMYVKTCVTGDLEGETNTLYWESFIPLTEQGSSYPNDDGAYGGFPDEQYPFGKTLSSGCRQGWILTQVPKDDKIVQVDYAPEGGETLAEWKTP